MLIKEELEQLLELQHIDDQLRELEDSKVYLPDMIANIENDLASWKKSYEEAQAKLDELNRARKHLELEIEVDQSELKKSQEQMKAIKTNKEYDALTAQIAKMKERINEHEEKLLGVMEEIDQTNEEVKESKDKYEELSKSNKDVLENLNKEIDSIEDKIRMKEEERKSIKGRVNSRTVSHYERVRKGKGGVAVVTVKKKSCGGCFKQLAPKMIQEVKKGERLITCDSCGRILLWAGDESQ
ncbi:MAG: hypothetical protein GF315_03930 [candidate division Zixibacteria bacterium]|nr:hypothetical protein [candidate division Zixibacteria bacterium]